MVEGKKPGELLFVLDGSCALTAKWNKDKSNRVEAVDAKLEVAIMERWRARRRRILSSASDLSTDWKTK